MKVDFIEACRMAESGEIDEMTSNIDDVYKRQNDTDKIIDFTGLTILEALGEWEVEPKQVTVEWEE